MIEQGEPGLCANATPVWLRPQSRLVTRTEFNVNIHLRNVATAALFLALSIANAQSAVAQTELMKSTAARIAPPRESIGSMVAKLVSFPRTSARSCAPRSSASSSGVLICWGERATRVLLCAFRLDTLITEFLL
jgi:hypothetical protein